MMGLFGFFALAITLVIVLWEMSDPENNTKMFLGIPSQTVLIYSLVVLGTNWSVFGEPMEQLRIFIAGMVAIPYVVAGGFAFFYRVYTYMWHLASQGQHKTQNRKKELRAEALLAKSKK